MNQKDLIEAAENILSDYERYKRDSHSYEIKGIFYSELLMFCAIAEIIKPELIIESGRARGQSTELIARYAADKGIEFHSIESNKSNGDSDIAEERLTELPVILHYGDSFEIMPFLVKDKKTLILIDGPKGSGMWKLLEIMYSIPNVAGVFTHDSGKGTSVRKNLDNKYPGKYIASDEKEFVKRFSFLDEECWAVNPWGPYEHGSYIQGKVLNLEKSESYSGTLAFVGK